MLMKKFERLKSNFINKSSICGGIFLIVTVLIITAFCVCSKYLTIINGMPTIVDGTLDMGQSDGWTVLPGEWEYYYNKWLISDNLLDAQPDGVIDMPDVWTGKTTLDGHILPRDGYGSFRLKIKNVKPGSEILVFANNYDGAYRTYINGVLNVEYGIMSKEISETKSNGRAERYLPYEVGQDETLDVIIEISNNNEGGMHYAFYLRSDFTSNQIYTGDQISFIVFGILVALFLMSIVVNCIYKEQKMWSLVCLLLLFVLMFIFSIDIYSLFCLSSKSFAYNGIAEIFYALAFVAVIVFIYHLYQMGIIKKPNKWLVGIFAFINVACILSFYLLFGYKERAVSVFIQLFLAALLYFPIAKAATEKIKYAKSYLIILLGIILLIGANLLDMIEFVIIGTESYASGIILVITFVISVMNFVRIADKNKEALQAEVYKRKLVTIKNEVLREQIKPHFVFNSLSAVRSVYHKSLDEGDVAVEKFASHLRAIVDADSKPMIRLDDEIDNILNYVGLVELGLNKSINLMLDIESYDIYLPILSLQPFVENAIKHSGVIYQEDGYILIKTEDAGKETIITIEDNGCGFDCKKVGENSVGLRNAIERIKFTLNTDAIIDSTIGKGTIIKIFVPKGDAK